MGAWCSSIPTRHVRSSESPHAPLTASTLPTARPRKALRETTDGAAALQALTNRTLFLNITDFLDEWPQFVHAFQRKMAEKYQIVHKQQHFYVFQTCIGFLVHAAIAENDQRMLERLYKLHKIPEYRWTDRVCFARAMRCAAYFGRLEMLEWMRHELPRDPKWTWETKLAACALQGKSSPGDAVLVLDWLYAHAPEESVEVFAFTIDQVAGRGDLEVITWLHDHDRKFTNSTMEKAAANGHLEVVQFLHEFGSIAGSYIRWMDLAADSGHLEVVRFLHENRTEGCTVKAMDKAAEKGYLEIVKFLHENRSEGCSADAIDRAALNGHLEVVQYLYEVVGVSVYPSTMDYAAASGRLEIVEYLHDKSIDGYTTDAMDQVCMWNYFLKEITSSLRLFTPSRKEIYYEVQEEHRQSLRGEAQRHYNILFPSRVDREASRKQLQIIQFLHENRTEGCTTLAMDIAAQMGHLEVVQFLHEHRSEGCTTDAMDYAAWRGHLDVVKFLHEHRTEGCTTEAVDLAARGGHVEVVKFLHNNRREGCTQAAMEFATSNGHLEALKFLHKMLIPESWGTLSDLMDRAAGGGHLEIVKYLHESRGSEVCSTSAMDQAAANGHLEIVKFLHESRSEGCTADAMNMAARGGHQDIVTFLIENRSEGNVEHALGSAAAGNKSLDLVRYLRESFPEAKVKSALERAASKNSIEIFEYLIQYRREGDVEDFVDTASSGYKTPCHEIIKVVCLHAPETCTEELLGAAFRSRDLQLVRTLCKYSNKGCLLEARVEAGRIPVLAEVVQVLDAFLSPEVGSCSSDLHSPEGPRRCQKVTTQFLP